jgi:hypothetical protein
MLDGVDFSTVLRIKVLKKLCIEEELKIESDA